MIKEYIDTIGTLKIQLYNEFGNLILEKDLKNLVVTTGKNWIVSRLGSNVSDVMSHMGLGSGTAIPVPEDINLISSMTRIALQSSIITDNTISYVGTFGPGINTGAVTEAGIFNAETGGTMLNRTTFDVVNKSAADTIIVTWNVTIT